VLHPLHWYLFSSKRLITQLACRSTPVNLYNGGKMNRFSYWGMLSFLSILIFSACAKEPSSEVEQDRIYTSYSLSYDDTNHSLEATVFFNFGGATGTYLSLDSSSSIGFDGIPMTLTTSVLNQAFYDTTLTTLLPSQIWGLHTFSYENNQGAVYTNQISLPMLPTIQLPAQASETVAFNVNWQITDTLGGDGLTLSILKSDGTASASADNVAVAPNGSSGTLTMYPSTLQAVPPGQYFVQVCRVHDSVPTEAPAIGGGMETSSCTAQVPVTLTL
jgi:hypothetical protein